MFDIAFSELVVIGLIALVVLGPKRLPEMARAAGRWTARLRRFVEDVKRDVHSELRREELAELRQVHQQLTDTKQILEQSVGSTFTGIEETHAPAPAPDYLVKALPDVAAPVRAKKKRTSKTGRNQPARPKTRKTATRHDRTGRKPKP